MNKIQQADQVHTIKTHRDEDERTKSVTSQSPKVTSNLHIYYINLKRGF